MLKLNTNQSINQLWKKPEYLENDELPQVTNKLFQCYAHLDAGENQTQNFITMYL